MVYEPAYYRAYILRMRRAGSAAAPVWRLLLEDVQTHERHGFSSPEQLATFLWQQAGDAPAPDPTAAGDSADA
jgi:hypothetical protein